MTQHADTIRTVAELPYLTPCPHCNGTGNHEGREQCNDAGDRLACAKCSGNGTIPRVIIQRNADQIAWRITDERGGVTITAATLDRAKESASFIADQSEEHGEQRPEILVVDSHETERAEILRNLQQAQAETRKAAADLDTLRRLIAELPWRDINTGDFRPQQGCPDVARFIEQAEALGVDRDRLRDGLARPYIVTGSFVVHFSVEIEEADSEEDAIDIAEQDISYYSVSVDGATVNDVETNGYDWEAEEA